MKVAVFVKATPSSEAGVMPSEQLMTAMGRFDAELVKAGVMLDGDGLQPSAKAVRVRFSGADRLVINGPFAETKELVAGYRMDGHGSCSAPCVKLAQPRMTTCSTKERS